MVVCYRIKNVVNGKQCWKLVRCRNEMYQNSCFGTAAVLKTDEISTRRRYRMYKNQTAEETYCCRLAISEKSVPSKMHCTGTRKLLRHRGNNSSVTEKWPNSATLGVTVRFFTAKFDHGKAWGRIAPTIDLSAKLNQWCGFQFWGKMVSNMWPN